MKIKVAALVTPDMVSFTKEYCEQIDELFVVIDVYHEPSDAIELLNKYREENDILLFGGPIPFLLVQDYIKRNNIELNKPMVYVPYNEVSIYRGLFKMIKDMEVQSSSPISLSIDYPAESEIRECLEELEMNTDHIYTKECGFNENLDKLVSTHYNLWKENKAQAIITSVYSVYRELKNLGLPTYRISPAKSSIRNTVHRALLEGRNMNQTESQIAIGIIGPGDSAATSEYEMKRKKLKLEQAILDFAEEIQALIDWSERGEIRFITTRGQIERITNHFQQIPILQEMKTNLSMTAFMGIGFGSTAHEAEIKAYEGFSKAKTVANGSCFIVEWDGNVHGPLGESSQLSYSVRSDDPKLMRIAKTVSLSVGTINKLLAFSEYPNNKKFTALELAGGFGITLRSARRILSKLEEHDFVQVIGEEQPISRGRPRQIYQLNFRLTKNTAEKR